MNWVVIRERSLPLTYESNVPTTQQMVRIPRFQAGSKATSSHKTTHSRIIAQVSLQLQVEFQPMADSKRSCLRWGPLSEFNHHSKARSSRQSRIDLNSPQMCQLLSLRMRNNSLTIEEIRSETSTSASNTHPPQTSPETQRPMQAAWSRPLDDNSHHLERAAIRMSHQDQNGTPTQKDTGPNLRTIALNLSIM